MTEEKAHEELDRMSEDILDAIAKYAQASEDIDIVDARNDFKYALNAFVDAAIKARAAQDRDGPVTPSTHGR